MKSEFIYEGDKLIKMILPYGSVSYEYDKCGRIIKQISDTGVSEAYSYDSMNRISEYCDTLGNITGYEYSRDGKIKSVNLSNDVRYLLEYDEVGRLIRKSRKSCAGENNLSYRYDNFGRVCEISTDTGRSNVYQYDDNGNITSIINGMRNTSCFKF